MMRHSAWCCIVTLRKRNVSLQLEPAKFNVINKEETRRLCACIVVCCLRQPRYIQVWLSCIFVEVFSRTQVDIHICSHTFFMYKDLSKIHIGQLIDARIKVCGLSYAEFARRLNVERTTVTTLFAQKALMSTVLSEYRISSTTTSFVSFISKKHLLPESE